MANSDYAETGQGSFTPMVMLDAPLGRFDTIINYSRFNFPSRDAVEVDMAVMVNGEIMSVIGVGVLSITVDRGCADTIPAEHPADSLVWIFDAGSVGTDEIEYAATEEVSVKVTPYTTSGAVPLEAAPPHLVEFNWRFHRPYPPGRFQINGERWVNVATLDIGEPALHLSWAHRDRVLQADHLVGHDAVSVGPEPGTTYSLSVIHPISGAVVRTEVGIVGTEFTYRRAQALHDLGQLTAAQRPTLLFTSMRDGFEAWQTYEAEFILAPGSIDTPPLMGFAQQVIESPYAINVARNVANYAGNFAVAMAARPVDRMADAYQLVGNGVQLVDGALFTPWVTLDFRMPELETTINIRTSSLFNGVSLAAAKAGDLILIDEELVQIETVSPTQIVVRRGCCDTVPRVHIAGTRAWIIGVTYSFDSVERTDGEPVQYKLRPVSYGTPYSLDDLPSNNITYSRRAELPYAPGRVVVNGRPWFEEVQAVSGAATVFTWVRRNRVAQGAGIVAHEDEDRGAEAGQVTRLQFFYETPATTEGGAPVEHVLRQQDIASPTGNANPASGMTFSYTYAMAQADGLVAGNALGICGTVVIYCRMLSVRDGLQSFQAYITPIRVPSFPC